MSGVTPCPHCGALPCDQVTRAMAPTAPHTAGPWQDLGEASYENGGPCRGVTADLGSHHKTVAKVPGWDEPETIANARLIAAAPDLLDALKAVLGCVNRFQNELTNERVRDAEAAIAKAEVQS